MYMDKLQQRPHCDVTGMTVSRGNYPNNFLISSIQVFWILWFIQMYVYVDM